MDEAGKSWVRRTNYSHTVFHRLNYSRSLSLHQEAVQSSGLKSRPTTSIPAVSNASQVQKSPATMKQRSLSPLAATFVSETFKEARHEQKRFSTPGRVVSKVSQVQKSPVTMKQRSLSSLPATFVSETFKEARHEQKRFSTLGPVVSKVSQVQKSPVMMKQKSLSPLPATFVSETFKEARLEQKSLSTRGPVVSKVSQVQKSPVTMKQRSLSPLPATFVSETFKEARQEQKRFATPGPQRKEEDKRIMGKLLNKDSHLSASKFPSSSPMKMFASMKLSGKSKNKDSGWTKYFDHGGGKVTAVETAEEWNVDLSKLFVRQRFAFGAHSKLYHGTYEEEPVAVKIITVPDDDENGVLAARLEKQFISEVTLLSRLHHQNVLKFVAACRKPSVYCVITEYLSEGSFRAYLHKLENKTISLQKLIAFALDIAHGMEYIHSQGVIHRDLKPENILINGDFHLKIADFGIACEDASCDLLADDPGTYRWMAPEMIKRKSYGRKVDVYSFGLILWEMLTGTIPYKEMTPIQAAFAVVNKNSRPVIPSSCPPAMRALIEQCWSLHPDKRPEFWQVVKVLEQFESSLARDGTLTLLQNPCSQDHKKGLRHWIQKLGPVHQSNGPMPKPKFT